MGIFDRLKRWLLGTSEPEHLRRPGRPDRGEAGLRRDASRPVHPGPREAAPGAGSTPPDGVRSLDAALELPDRFQPVSRDELSQGLAATARRDPWAWRSDIIPPSGHPRTDLIDRALVTNGFLTEERLADIREIGEQMDALRPHASLPFHLAEQAVARTQAERDARKAEKRAEAEERRRQREAAIAARRESDIVFLGRDVSKGLSDRRSNVEKLRAAGLPVLASPADLATALGLSIPRLRWLAFHSEAATRTHYVRFTVPKKSGGTRTLSTPHATLKSAQSWILREILDHVPTHDAAHGFVRGRSTRSAALPHVARDVVVNADLESFFPSITFWRVDGLFRSLGYSPAVATILALLATESPRVILEHEGTSYFTAAGPRALPQGAPTSPAISNLVARRLDARLEGIARKLDFTYTRYADDLSFSASGEPARQLVGYLLARLRHIAQDEGFRVQETKTRVLRRNASQRVTGIVVNDRPAVPRQVTRRLRAILHRAATEGLAAQNREQHPHFEAWVRGMIAYVSSVDERRGAELRAALARARA